MNMGELCCPGEFGANLAVRRRGVQMTTFGVKLLPFSMALWPILEVRVGATRGSISLWSYLPYSVTNVGLTSGGSKHA